MARNGSGTYTLAAGNPVVTGTTISSTTHNNTMTDLETAMTNSLAKNGETVLTGNLDFNGTKLILDADGDSSLTLDTDDQWDFEVAGSDVMVLTAASLTHTGTFEPSGDTAAGDNSAMGYTAAEGLILTGQGSTNDVTVKNDADAAVIQIPTGTTNVSVVGTISAATGSTIGNITLADGSITDSSGAISFGNENLTTTGTFNCGALTSLGIDDNATSVAITIDASENVFISKTSSAIGTAGFQTLVSGETAITRDGAAPASINRLTDDGILLYFYAQSNVEGDITVSGTTVTLTGAHTSFLSQLPLSHVGGRRDNTIKRGTVMEYCNEKAEWYYEDWEEDEPELDKQGRPTGKTLKARKRLVVDGVEGGTGKGAVYQKENEQRMRTCPSTTKGTKKVAGVFQGWDDDNAYDNKPEDNNTWDYDFKVATSGDFVGRVTGPCEIGDLLESNGDGTMVVQADDIMRSSTIAKAIQTFDTIPAGQENPELVPCQLLNG